MPRRVKSSLVGRGGPRRGELQPACDGRLGVPGTRAGGARLAAAFTVGRCRLPAGRMAELVAAGAGQPFHSGGRLVREWVLVRPADEAACAAYVDEAHRAVDAGGSG